MTEMLAGVDIDGNPRRLHTKSRFGCKVCKQRRVKCDEKRPACGNCIKSRRLCSYLSQNAVLPPQPVKSPSISTSPASTLDTSQGLSPTLSLLSHDPSPPLPLGFLPTSVHASPEGSASQNNISYKIIHFELWHHYIYHMVNVFYQDDKDLATDFRELSITLALKSSYLTDETLALAAAHKSTTIHDKLARKIYHHEAIQLQTRALKHFNPAEIDVEGYGALSTFLFSSFLGHQVLFDTFSDQTELSSVLERLVRCLELHRGMRSIVGRSYTLMIEQVRQLQPRGSRLVHEFAHKASNNFHGEECAALLVLIQQTELQPTEKEVYYDVIHILQELIDGQKDPAISSFRRINAAQEWPIRISTEYIVLLTQRRPESLVILAHYAMILHEARWYWAFLGAGRFLIQAIAAHLGPYWAKWLEVPLRALEGDI